MRKMIWMLGLLLIFSDVGWGAQKWTSSVLPTIPPQTSSSNIGVGCYDAWTGLPLDCQFSFSLNGIELSGGHIHYDRPNGGLSISPLLPAIFINISDHTDYQYKTLRYEAPQASGIVTLNSTYTPPYGYRCLNPSDCKYEGTIDIKVGGLETMPVSGEGQWRLTGQTSNHPDNHYGTASTKGAMSLIAVEYFELTDGRGLGINDMSLEWGGLFDIDNNWHTPHHEHRTGTDADIDRDGINCNDDEYLWSAIDKLNQYGYVAGGQPQADLLCEPGGRKHIDFD